MSRQISSSKNARGRDLQVKLDVRWALRAQKLFLLMKDKMTYAIDGDNELCEASPKMTRKCPNCKKDVFSKCGDIRVWHWSHHVHESCEYSKIKDSIWRYEWIKKTVKDKAEKLINGQIVDVLGNNNAKVLFISNTIEKEEIEEKEIAFNDRIIWVLKSDSFKYLKIYKDDYRYERQENHYSFEWKRPRKEWNSIDKDKSFLFFDVGDEKTLFRNNYDSEGIGIIKNRLLYAKEFEGDSYEIHGRVIEMEEEKFIKRYL